MQYLLSRACRPILTRLTRERTLFAFDFDGTLAPIVDHPNKAKMRARTLKLLRRLAALYPCVIVSGRARSDVLERMRGVEVSRVIGNHGAETAASNRSAHRRVALWKAALKREIGSVAGVWLEDKGMSLAVHYRQSTVKAKVRRQILAVTQGLKHVRVFGGKQVMNVVWDRANHKGHALATERKRLACEWVLYVGDDENDEDAFALDGKTVPVRVGRKKDSHARYYLRTQLEIDDLLALLVLDTIR